MKISVGETREIVLEEVFENVVFRTLEGEELVVSMRDDGFNIAVRDLEAKSLNGEKYYQWYLANNKGIVPFHLTMCNHWDSGWCYSKNSPKNGKCVGLQNCVIRREDE